MYKYFLYGYIEETEYRYYDYKNEPEKNDFDFGNIKAFDNALNVMKNLLEKNNFLQVSRVSKEDSGIIIEHKKKMVFNLNTDIDLDEEKLVEITKRYVIEIQKLYNALLKETNLFSQGEKFGYYHVLDILENDFKYSKYKKFVKNFNIPIPVSLDKKVKISKI